MSVFRIPLRSNTFTKRRANSSANNDESPLSLANDERDDDQGGLGQAQEDVSSDEEEDTVGVPQQRINLSAGKHRSLRYQHIEVLVTLVHKCILDQDWPRAERAYGLLLRCKGIDVRLCHDLGLTILNHADPTGRRSIEFLSRLIVAYPPVKPRHGKRTFDRAEVFVKLLTQLRIQHKQYRLAMQELETWLLVPPYKDDVELWQYLVNVCGALEEEQTNGEVDDTELARLSAKKRKAQARVNGDGFMDVEDD
ncbi:RNA polymerase I-specific transcription initiation factor rrn11 [Taphrina deformans PYCC 5710]|uniref:RNA polymerase I-specific transcription initiation factor rrn11 n=1 Tax=Taphrina deformans (strain PYCC 5710 / ATCC 11124 / CBS 356.35 / IMI 108563 / JCM 9778 / NBRC 8474) TaxID=1097556 RepID=R4X8C1_TAPDE|nr:RNA polymerase I-specific transcription initiation factor rrn11 [Taphrina deformans PYCC 5710]|eukprot:CCG81522.1 RNA polymerase I-specific transcription initiation factor rrn11 [Taphrina deformans PYCC 5710]